MGKGVSALAPGARVVVRDPEWLPRKVNRTSTGGRSSRDLALSRTASAGGSRSGGETGRSAPRDPLGHGTAADRRGFRQGGSPGSASARLQCGLRRHQPPLPLPPHDPFRHPLVHLIRFESSRQPERIVLDRNEEELRRIDRLFDDYLEWIEESMNTEDNPYVQVVAVLVEAPG